MHSAMSFGLARKKAAKKDVPDGIGSLNDIFAARPSPSPAKMSALPNKAVKDSKKRAPALSSFSSGPKKLKPSTSTSTTANSGKQYARPPRAFAKGYPPPAAVRHPNRASASSAAAAAAAASSQRGPLSLRQVALRIASLTATQLQEEILSIMTTRRLPYLEDKEKIPLIAKTLEGRRLRIEPLK